MKRGEIVKKEDSKFYPTVFKVVKIKYTMITMQSDNGKIYTRHISFFKKVNRKTSQTTPTPSELTLPKKYPKRNRKQFGH